jgi:type VI secretion system secreted protein Hcp
VKGGETLADVDYFLKLDGVKGESSDAKHKDEIELVSFSWAMNQSGTHAGGGGGGAGKVTFSDLSFVQRTQRSTTALMQVCASGKHIPSALLTARKAGKGQMEFLKIKLTDVLVSSFHIGADDTELPVESIALNAAKVEVDYSAQDPTGKAVTPSHFGWDIKVNKAV